MTKQMQYKEEMKISLKCSDDRHLLQTIRILHVIVHI